MALLKTNIDGYSKDTNTNIVLNKNKQDLEAYKNSIKNTKKISNIETRQTKVEKDIEVIKEILIDLLDNKECKELLLNILESK